MSASIAHHQPIADLVEMLSSAANADNAAAMRAYQRNRFDFLGIKTPQRRSASTKLVAVSRTVSIDSLVDLVTDLRGRREREYHYVASDVLRANADRLPARSIDDIRRWIQTDSWWDTVDAIASPTVGTMVRNHPGLVAVMDRWIEDDDIWLARTAILHQLRFGEDTDEGRLFRYAERRSGDREFFVRKAIGWALRQYARTDPNAVRTFLDSHRDDLQPLTIREASKHLT